MMPRFTTVGEAIAQGYRMPVRGQDQDVSGPNNFGYVYQDPEGHRTIAVWIDDDSQVGKVIALFPPR